MKAFTKSKYGGPEVLQLEEVDKPVLKDNCLLVRIMANSANPADWHIIRGKPFFARFSSGLFKPSYKIAGADFAGIVEETGTQVTRFKPGDRVFGEMLDGGAFAEYASIPENVCALMPDDSGFTEMACVPIAGLTAFQAVIEHGKLKNGETVLVNGASGGVGHFTVQIAKAYGGRVTGVCSGRNVDFVKSLGAHEVIAYDEIDIHNYNGKYDLIIDTNGNLDYGDFKRMGRRGVLTGFTTLGHMISVMAASAFGKFPLAQFTARAKVRDLETLADMIEHGKINVHIEKTFPYKEIPEAISFIERMRTRGKVAMTWEV